MDDRMQELRQFVSRHSGHMPPKMTRTFLQLANRSSSQSFRFSQSVSQKASPLVSKQSSPLPSGANSPNGTKRRSSHIVLKPITSHPASTAPTERQPPKRVPDYRTVFLSAGYFLFEKYPIIQFDVSLIRSSLCSLQTRSVTRSS